MARKPDLAADVEGDVTDTPAKSRSYGINHFRILGRMTADPEQRFTQSGKAVVNLGIATNVNGFAEFHDVVAWEKAAEIIGQYGRKGREIHVEGRITSRIRDVEGHRVKRLDLVVESLRLLRASTHRRGRGLAGHGAGKPAPLPQNRRTSSAVPERWLSATSTRSGPWPHSHFCSHALGPRKTDVSGPPSSPLSCVNSRATTWCTALAPWPAGRARHRVAGR